MVAKESEDCTNKKKTLTIVGKNLAKKGNVFLYTGSLAECRSCKVKNICFSLVPGRTYVITAVREREHKCEVFADGGKVVEVELAPIAIAVDTKKAIEGSIVTPRETDCPVKSCSFNRKCSLKDIRKGDKLKIVSVGKSIECPEKRIEVEAVPVE